ncbi:2-dehydropantoate 2-reductase [Arthrobacter sp. SPG23]|uniref:ketopantoate reductase family protein n=1 Tax=Arthrobacter sp. SPG23 TaxID=1610703 RepID=UPI0005B7E2B9|nr:ketopantoate reductase family protein [Arthrobacter sp. SPG23]KIS25720.1 2-dehydropantoate 2-reductase [Arthrobacter sp. SPG23]
MASQQNAARILVVGAGATGGYFGARLAQGGRDVTFLVREGRAATLRGRGLRITGLGREDVIEPRLVTAADLAGPYDVVLVTVKASALPRALADLAPAVGPETVIVPFLNGMAHLDSLVAAFGAGRVLGGIVKVVTTVTDDGDILQMNPLATLTVGELSGPPSDRVLRAVETFTVPGFKASATADALASMWHKWVFIVAAGSVTCLMRGPVGAIVAVPGGTDFVQSVLAEAGAVSAAAGYPVPDHETEASLAMLTQPGSTFTSSLYRDVVAGLPGEAEHLLGDFTRRARVLGADTPLIDLALMQLRVQAETS